MTNTIFVEVIQQSLWCVCFVCHVYESLLSLKDSVKRVSVNKQEGFWVESQLPAPQVNKYEHVWSPGRGSTSEQVWTCLELGGWVGSTSEQVWTCLEPGWVGSTSEQVWTCLELGGGWVPQVNKFEHVWSWGVWWVPQVNKFEHVWSWGWGGFHKWTSLNMFGAGGWVGPTSEQVWTCLELGGVWVPQVNKFEHVWSWGWVGSTSEQVWTCLEPRDGWVPQVNKFEHVWSWGWVGSTSKQVWTCLELGMGGFHKWTSLNMLGAGGGWVPGLLLRIFRHSYCGRVVQKSHSSTPKFTCPHLEHTKYVKASKVKP